jgi:hypothetical protein
MVGMAQPSPGDVFREYKWFKENGDAGGALRVGGKEGTTDWNTQIIGEYWVTDGINLEHAIDLEYAIKAEINVEKILCHDGTYDLGIQINDKEWITIPESDKITEPQKFYQHHIYPTVPLPLKNLNPGKNKSYKMRENKHHERNWPQNLIYGMHIRIYYDPEKKAHPTGQIISPQPGQVIGVSILLKVECESITGSIEQIDFIGNYEDVNYEGDGIYHQWHYHFFHGKIMHHLGTVKNEPYRLLWNTSWIPNQKVPMQIAARIIDDNGMIYFTKAVSNLRLFRRNLSVELCKPSQIPQKWVTRSGEHSEVFNIKKDLKKAVAYQLLWSSWSPGYMNGIYINEEKVFDSEGPKYAYYFHRITLEDVSVLKSGSNVLKTGKTPLYDGNMVHGMEVNWPGIMVLVQYKETVDKYESKMLYNHSNYPNPFNSETTIYYNLAEADNISLTTGMFLSAL